MTTDRYNKKPKIITAPNDAPFSIPYRLNKSTRIKVRIRTYTVALSVEEKKDTISEGIILNRNIKWNVSIRIKTNRIDSK